MSFSARSHWSACSRSSVSPASVSRTVARAFGPAGDELVADERAVLLVVDVFRVRGREQPAQLRVVRVVEQAFELVEEVAEEEPLVDVEPQLHLVPPALELRSRKH